MKDPLEKKMATDSSILLMNRGARQAAISGVAEESDTIEQLNNILDITSGLSKTYRNSLYNFCTLL